MLYKSEIVTSLFIMNLSRCMSNKYAKVKKTELHFKSHNISNKLEWPDSAISNINSIKFDCYKKCLNNLSTWRVILLTIVTVLASTGYMCIYIHTYKIPQNEMKSSASVQILI